MNQGKREKIIEAAALLFIKYGFGETPTAKIAKAAGIGVGTLFNYFPTKDILIREIYQYIMIHSREVFMKSYLIESSTHDTLQSMYKALVYWGIKNPGEFKYLELFMFSPYYNIYKSKKAMEDYYIFRKNILKSLGHKNFCENYPEYILMHIDSQIHTTTRFIINNNIKDIEPFINSSFELLWCCLSKKETEE